MSVIRAICDIQNKNCDFDLTPMDIRYANIELGFRRGGEKNITFDNCSFGLEFYDQGKCIQSQKWPEPGFTLVCTDQDIMQHSRVNFDPNKEYTLKVWIENAGERTEGLYTFITPSAPDWEVE
jgi:hypothetical protein